MEAKYRKVEERLQELPIVQFAWLTADEVPFSEHVRTICRTECPRYGKSWSCPPGVGTVEECHHRCREYSGAFVFTTVAEVADASDMEETLATREEHEAVTKEIRQIFEEVFGGRTLALSADSCAICRECAYPGEPCRHPDQMLPCLESYGIVVPKLAEQAGIAFMNGTNILTWFGLVLFTE